MRFVFWAFVVLLPSSLLAVASEAFWVQEHLRFVRDKYHLQLLAEGSDREANEGIDFEFISFFPSDLDTARILLVTCVEHLKSLSKKEKKMDWRYGISFLDLKGDLRKEGIARVSVLTPKKIGKEKVFFSISDKKSSKLTTKYAEDYIEACEEVNLALSENQFIFPGSRQKEFKK